MCPAWMLRDYLNHQRVAGDWILHRVFLFGIVGLLLNDHVFKACCPSYLTGKASDFLGMIFFPMFLASSFELFARSIRISWRLGRIGIGACVIATGVVFAAINLVHSFAEIYRELVASVYLALGWPATRSQIISSVHVMDPSDLLALPALIVPYWIAHYRLKAERPPRTVADVPDEALASRPQDQSGVGP